jgi:restriction system protein
MVPLMQALRDLGGSGTVEEIYGKTVEIAGIPDELLAQLHDPDRSNQTEVGYRLAWARTYLRKFGLLDNSSRGVWSLTEKGRTTAELNGAEVAKFVRNLSKANASKQPSAVEEAIAPDVTATEDFWREQLASVLTKELSPAAFERLVQRMLRESGFVAVEVTGRTGDGGIDGKGIARVHGFMSFHVLFQCKRYKNSVGASEIRDFRGAMVGRADKGLFITTGTFTPAAVREATRDGAPAIDLVDGEELMDKLKELGLGVKTETIQRVSIDPEWFKNF